jgi:hypothetical protein
MGPFFCIYYLIDTENLPLTASISKTEMSVDVNYLNSIAQGNLLQRNSHFSDFQYYSIEMLTAANGIPISVISNNYYSIEMLISHDIVYY